jgi:general stress protein YciG
VGHDVGVDPVHELDLKEEREGGREGKVNRTRNIKREGGNEGG